MAVSRFDKNTGKKLFNTRIQRTLPPPSEAEIAAMNDAANNSILLYLGTRHFPVTGLKIDYDLPTATVRVRGLAADNAARERIVECCGDIAGVEFVDDRMAVAEMGSETESTERPIGIPLAGGGGRASLPAGQA